MAERTGEYAREADVRLIPDEPADVDFFSTHTEIAQAIEIAIRENPHAKVFGLFGTWGSGKSTVVKSIAAAFDSDDHYLVFTYDAWLHQNDSIKRSFLESLHYKLRDSKILSGLSWDEKLSELGKTVQDTETTETPNLTLDILVIAVSLLLVPLGASLIDVDTISQAFGDSTTSAGILTFWTGLSLVLAPAWTWIVLFLSRRPWKSVFSRDVFSSRFWRVVDSQGHPAEILPVFVGQTPTRKKTRSISRPEPTSLEFGRMFQDIMLEATKQNRHFIIIIDNLDRISARQAGEIWSTIRSFFLSASRNEADTDHELYHPTVILPIDQSAVDEIFDGENSQSFIEKTFDAVFRVPAPISSDWREFLISQLRVAFGPICNEDEAYWIRRIYEEKVADQELGVTPRQVNKYVNRLVALYMQWGKYQIPLRVLAFYEAYLAEISTDIVGFLSKYDGGAFQGREDWKNLVAAVHYGVRPEKAAQVLLESKLRSAIRRRNEAAFNMLSANIGFLEVLELVLSKPLSPLPGQSALGIATNAAYLVSKMNIPDSSPPLVAAWWRLTEIAAEAIPAETSLATVGDAMNVFGGHVANQQASEFITNTAGFLRTQLDLDELSDEQLQAICEALGKLTDIAQQASTQLPEMKLKIGLDQFLRRLAAVARSSEAWKALRSDLLADAIQEGMMSMLGKADTESLVPTLVKVFNEREASDPIYGGNTRVEWDGLISTAADVLRGFQSSGLSPNNALAVLRMLQFDEQVVGGSIDNLVEEGVHRKVFEPLLEKGDEGLIDLFAILLWRAKSAPLPYYSERKLHAIRDDFISTLWERLNCGEEGDAARKVWASYHAEYSLREVASAIVDHLVTTGTLGGLSSQEVLARSRYFRAPVPYGKRERYRALIVESEDFWRRFDLAPLNAGLYETIVALLKEGEVEEHLLYDHLRARVNGTSEDDWLSAIKFGLEPYKIQTELLHKEGVRFDIKSNLAKALSSGINTLISGSDQATRLRWFELRDSLNSRAAASVTKELASKLAGASPGSAVQILKDGGVAFRRAYLNSVDSVKVGDALDSFLKLKSGRAFLIDHSQTFRAVARRVLEGENSPLLATLTRMKTSRSGAKSEVAVRLLDDWS